jgi:hypothetical protein
MPIYLIERALNFWVLKNLDNPIASCTGIELNNVQGLARGKEDRREIDIVGSDAGDGFSSPPPVVAQPGSVSPV